MVDQTLARDSKKSGYPARWMDIQQTKGRMLQVPCQRKNIAYMS